MKRQSLLPDDIADWVRSLPRTELQKRLASAITDCVTRAGLVFDEKNLAAEVEAHDTRYFDAQDEGRDGDAAQEFSYARLLAAQQFLLTGKEEEAVYEFFHSLDEQTSEALFNALKKG